MSDPDAPDRSGGRGSDPPADVSDQNREEPSAPHPPQSGGPPGSDDAHASEDAPESDRSGERAKPPDDGGQATGHPENAG